MINGNIWTSLKTESLEVFPIPLDMFIKIASNHATIAVTTNSIFTCIRQYRYLSLCRCYSINYLFLESTPCKNDSECDHSNCYYCTSAGYCRIAGLNYCGIYDCGIGDGSCISGFTGSFAGCKSNLTCGRDNFKYYHPLPDHCLCHHVMCRKYSACVPKGI